MEGEDKVNTIFIGSSRVHCHINPKQFDKETDEASFSWNIGAPGAAGLEVQRIVRDIVNTAHSHNIKTIYAEMPRYTPPPIQNEGNLRASYFYTVPQWYRSVRFTINRKKPLKKRVSIIIDSARPLIANLIGINTLRHQLKGLFDNNLAGNIKTSQKRGFSGLKGTVKNYGPVKTRLQNARNFYSNSADSVELENDYLTADLSQLIEKAEKKGIRIVYVLMPKIPLSMYEDNFHSLKQLHAKNKLNLSSPVDYPKFYEPKYSSDKAHLNIHGAKIMTSLFAEHYNQYVEK